ncbi:MAG: symmetrical bis(5'-nucleosyl)-tetraphosphatase [Betaproteobacteria bacterium]|nr:symmetrical bis(5'-nucleosyl)-tetraphosphatase [Betaproteobacteria bacterium]NDD11161.1 symmetrical bis(5'-nucleosyl)-tetraphosphatase [Betaproteobacteria bacterium]
MTRWAIGDIQGCYDEFMSLVTRIDSKGDPRSVAKLWLVGDLINRGPKSLEVLEWVMKHQDRCRVVLGNHDLNFLAIASQTRQPRSDDTLTELLHAKSRNRYVDWIRQQQLAHFEDGILMVHAGVPLHWDVSLTLANAAEVEYRLQSWDWVSCVESMYGNEPSRWNTELKGTERRRFTVNALTRMRFCSLDGTLEFKSKEAVARAPDGCLPWFALPDRRCAKTPIVFGHWSTLGLVNSAHIMALDTGCVWGGSLTAMNLDTRELIQEPSRQASIAARTRVASS